MKSDELRLHDLLPHRKPMLLLDRLISVSSSSAVTEVVIENSSAFRESENGVPCWIGLEYMGQTAALIGGYQGLLAARDNPDSEPRLGYLVGTRRYRAHCSHFSCGATLRVSCEEERVVGESLARYQCEISLAATGDRLADAVLTVVRKSVNDAKLL